MRLGAGAERECGDYYVLQCTAGVLSKGTVLHTVVQYVLGTETLYNPTQASQF